MKFKKDEWVTQINTLSGTVGLAPLSLLRPDVRRAVEGIGILPSWLWYPGSDKFEEWYSEGMPREELL